MGIDQEALRVAYHPPEGGEPSSDIGGKGERRVEGSSIAYPGEGYAPVLTLTRLPTGFQTGNAASLDMRAHGT